MTFSAIVRFWIRPDGCGYEKLWFATSHFAWLLSDCQFEAIHGLSRLMNLFPNQLATARELRRSGDRSRADRCLDFLLRTLRFYRSLVDLQIEDSSNIEDASFDVELNSREIEILESSRGLSLLETVNLLDSTLLQTFQAEAHDGFLAQAADLIMLADLVRVACNVYLLFAHPLLIWSRRPGVPFQDLDQLSQRAENIINWSRHNQHYLSSLWQEH